MKMTRSKSREKYIERFLSRVEKTPTCWKWKGQKDIGGYGIFWYEGKARKAHRVSWVLFKGEISPNLKACHKCDTRDCVNPEHLFIGTNMDNFIDAVKKGRINPTGQTNHRAKLTDDEVRLIKNWYGRKMGFTILGQIFGVTKNAVYNIITGREWRHI